MSKRLKYAKLRLVKPINEDDPPPIVVPDVGNVCTDGTGIDKTSKYFNNIAEEPCAGEETFILIHSEDSGEDNEMAKEKCSRRRQQKLPEACSNDGPKLPKLRKKSCEGNRLISNFLSSQTNQVAERDDDFEDCKTGTSSQLKQTKVQSITRKTSKPPKRLKKQSDIRKVFKKYKNDHEVLHEFLKQHSASEQIDPEQLQIALAMSRSLLDQECGQKPTSVKSPSKDCSASSCSGSSEERRIVSIRTTLEQFGFRCKNSYTDYDLNVIFGSASTKNVKKIKHKRATNLQPRSKEDLAAFIDSQVKKTIPFITIEKTISAGTSHELENIQTHLSNHFWIAQTELSSDQLMEKYYVPELLNASPAPVGCMLKDWSKIPGRERTPDRNNGASTGKINVRVNSPDLFNDSEIINNVAECDTIEEALLNKIDAERDKQECGMENEQKWHPQEVLVISSSNESGCYKLNVASPFLKEASEASDMNNIEQVVEKNKTTSQDMDEIPVLDKSRELQGEIVVLNDNSAEESNNFVTDISECPQLAFHQSSENIFDETDTNPMVSFEVYSSEEEKIAAASQKRVGMVSSNEDIGTTNKAQQDCRKDIILQQNNGNGLLSGEDTNIAIKTAENGNNSIVMGARFSYEKDLSFHRLSIKARLSEALEGKAHMVAKVDLMASTPDFDKTISNVAELNVNIPIGTQCSRLDNAQDDVLYISEDEMNYSICCESLRVPAASVIESVEEKIEIKSKSGAKEDPDLTVSYHIAKSRSESETDVFSNYSYDKGNESVVAEINCAESTFAYLDHLVKEFNLPPIKSQQNMQIDKTNQHVSIERDVTDEKELESMKMECSYHSIRGIMSDEHVSKISNELSNTIQTNEEPKFDDHEIAAEIIASQSPQIDSTLNAGIGTTSSKVFRKHKSCTQFDSPGGCSAFKRTVSETGFPSSSTPNEKDAQNQSSTFENKFNELKAVAVDMSAADYIIRTSNVNQKPPAYEDMSTSEIERELFKYGLKALQRNKAIRVLHYLFDMMHPYVMLVERHNIPMEKENNHSKTKDAKEKHKLIPTPYNLAVLTTPQKCAFKLDLKSTHFFLSSKPRKKMAWCAVPLHISFFNLVSESEFLQRQILRYEPINLDEVYRLLKDAGLRYETNDLVAFLDKHCITFRSASSNGDQMAKVKSKDGNE